MLRCRVILVAAALCLPAVVLASRSAGQPEAGEAAAGPQPVRDLAYGEVLFYFYQGKYFDALTRLLAAQQRNELPHDADEAQLLLGGLYLSYGEHLLAGQILQDTLKRSGDSAVRDRVWFFLAKIWYERGYLKESEAALQRIQNELPGTLESERRMLYAQVLMDQQRFDEALGALGQWKRGDAAWIGYAKYNMGVALVRLGRVEEGAKILDELGSADEEKDPKLAALRDKANVALGYAWLQASRPSEAKPSLQRVRLSGPYSNKALLGVGWADAESRQYQAALAPWMELRGRSLLDPAVQESLLAVPYAFAQLGADSQAADYYTQAIDSFDRQIEQIDTSIQAIESGALLSQLLAQQDADGSGWYWRLDQIPKSDETRYLYDLLSTNRFQEGLKNYRDLLYLNRNLDQWAGSLTAFDDILDTRQRAYQQRLPAIDASLGRMDLDQMAQDRVRLASRLMATERREDAVALGTPKQQSLWRELQSMEPDLARLGNGERAETLRSKQRFLKGLLLWDLERDYKARLWAQKKNLRDLDVKIKQAQQLRQEVQTARDDWPEQFAQLTRRIGALRPRVAALQARAGDALESQREFLKGVAVDELRAQSARLNTYRVQARFALSALYDRAAANRNPVPATAAAGASE